MSNSSFSGHGVLSLAKSLVCIEFAFALFVIPAISGLQTPLPISITKIFFVLCGLWIGHSVLTRKLVINPTSLVAFGVFAAVIAYSSTFLESEYSDYKLKVFVTYTSFAYLAGTMIIRDSGSFDRFLQAMLILGIGCSLISLLGFMLGIEFFVDPEIEDTRRARVGSSNPIPLGRLSGAAALITVYFFSSRTVIRGIQTGILGILVLAILASGSRGPLIAALFSGGLGFGADLLSSKGLGRGQILAVAVLVLVGTVVFLFAAGRDEFSHSIDRISELASEGVDFESDTSRFSFWPIVSRMYESRPIMGWGLGSFKNFVFTEAERAYPHNLIWELMSETGSIGLLAFGLLLVPFFRVLRQGFLKRSAAPHVKMLAMLSFYFLLNAMVSGDLNDNRMAFFFLGICASPFASKSSRWLGELK